MSVFVKICGLRDAQNIAAAVDAGCDAVGFVFADSVRRIGAAEAHAISESIPEKVLRVAVMRQPSNEEWQTVLETLSPDVLQTDADDFANLDVPDSVVRWPVYRQNNSGDTQAFPEVFVYEGENSGAGETVDWSLAAELADQGRMMLAGGLTADNVAAAIKTARPWGVDVSSGVESSPGKKDSELIRKFISAARAAESYR